MLAAAPTGNISGEATTPLSNNWLEATRTVAIATKTQPPCIVIAQHAASDAARFPRITRAMQHPAASSTTGSPHFRCQIFIEA